VTACKTCNNAKDCYTPDEAGMKMSYQPRYHKVDAFYFVKDIPDEWKVFL
jgi:5-methylcytosine-specific restriction endonuclease McrA